MTTNVQAPPSLTAADRCDRCGAQAYLLATLPTGGELRFCVHHAREHGDAISKIPGVTIHDETAKVEPAAETKTADDRR